MIRADQKIIPDEPHEAVLSKAKAQVPGPEKGQVSVEFQVVPLIENNFETYEALRLKAASSAPGDTVLVVYDVSPRGTSQSLADDLQRFPNIMVFDHHGGAAPVVEVRGKELTAAEVAVGALSKLWESGALINDSGEPLTVVAATHTLNVDPDAVITGLFIESFMDPEKRSLIWSDQNRELLVRAARFGDISLFGGIDIPNLRIDNLSEEMKIAFTILDLINREKEQLVIDQKLGEVATEQNLRKASEMWFAKPGSNFANQQEARIELEETIKSRAIVKGGLDGAQQATIVTRDILLRQILGAEFVTPEKLREQPFKTLRDSVFSTLSRSQVREVFAGKLVGDIYSSPHSSHWNENSINRLLSNIRETMPEVLADPLSFEENYWAFAKGLQDVHAMAADCSTFTALRRSPENRISVSSPNGRIDHREGLPQDKQSFPVYDWLREASAAYGDPMLHIMNRDGIMTIAARAAQPGEEAPIVALNNPEFIADLTLIEETRAQANGVPPAQFLIKANLVLPFGPHNISFAEVLSLLLVHYENIVTPYNKDQLLAEPIMNSVDYGDGHVGPFDGTIHFLKARGIYTQSESLTR